MNKIINYVESFVLLYVLLPLIIFYVWLTERKNRKEE